jgi:predicted  nucleic acid-binding Zn-ribbon protein
LDQKEEIEKKFEDEKFVVKAWDEKEAEYRADLLKVKNERKQISVKSNSLEKEREKLELEITKLLTEVNDLKRVVSEKNYVLKKSEDEVKKLQAESISLQKDISDLIVKIESLESKINKKVPEVKLYHCTVCSFKTETPVLLKQHVLNSHCQHKQSQANQSPSTEHSEETSFSEYCCFYCDLTLMSVEHLETHRIECQDNSIFYI